MRSKPLHMDGDLKDYTQEEILQIEAVLNSLFFKDSGAIHLTGPMLDLVV